VIRQVSEYQQYQEATVDEELEGEEDQLDDMMT
jgi:hypothetical protein